MKLLTMAILVIGTFAAANNIQQAHADDNNRNDKKPCNDQHSASSTKCSHKDTTPFILPFP
ncbi:MAG: hypothetical protein DLM72_13495 [Candidatus Nitrosopolaris wilkensis]|nr:MAG: hypothetical protein DLM72_13495 [Candidatus Nitrosopolaris wilkensis]